MAHKLSTTDLRNMQIEELEKDLREKRLAVTKMRLGIDMQSHKDTAQYKRGKKEIARILTVLREKKGSPKALNTKPKSSTLLAHRSSSGGGPAPASSKKKAARS